jgi:hypothetical protein
LPYCFRLGTYQNLWDTADSSTKGKVCSYEHLHETKTESSQMNILMIHFELLEKQEEAKPQIRR